MIGAGALGLTTARLVQEARLPVTLYAASFPPDTTSNIAGGEWHPAFSYHAAAVNDAFRLQLYLASRYSYDRFTAMVGPKYGIRTMDRYLLSYTDDPPEDVDRVIADLLPRQPPARAGGASVPLSLCARLAMPFGSRRRSSSSRWSRICARAARASSRAASTRRRARKPRRDADLQLHRAWREGAFRRRQARIVARPARAAAAPARGDLCGPGAGQHLHVLARRRGDPGRRGGEERQGRARPDQTTAILARHASLFRRMGCA
ncbi:MAG: FAD-dependent oxidoreductase [Sphingomonas sp.]